jgi:hypothetical protein
MSRCTSTIAAATLLTGCYYRTSLTPASATPGTTVRISLTGAASHDLADALGGDARTLDGRVVRSSPETLVVAVREVERVDGHRIPWQGERVALPYADVAAIERRRFSAPATALVVAGSVAALILAAKVAGQAPVMH